MKWIKYKIVCNADENILLDKKMEYNEANLSIAQSEAYNGEYAIEEDAASFETKPLAIEFGGTGAKTSAEARKALGLSNANGALPIESGGTGATTAAEALKKLGIVYSSTKPTYVPGMIWLKPVNEVIV